MRDPSTPRFQPRRDPWPSTGSSTTAAAPSPKRNALVRSSQLVIRVKVSGEAAHPATLAPEYEDCRKAALAHDVPLKLVIEEAAAAARRMLS